MQVRNKIGIILVPVKTRIMNKELEVTLGRSIEDLDFHVLGARAYNCIKAAGIENLGELAKKTTDDVLGWKNSGTITVGRINKALKPFGLSLNMEFVSLPEEVGKLAPVSDLLYPLNE
jgi:DNA-directed RNA polymerase alpha subunit